MARILVVDEDELLRASLRRLLTLEGHDVVEADGGLRAVELARSDPPDLVLCDLLMPDLDGDQVARCLRRDPRTADVPIVILTGSAVLPPGKSIGATDADDYVTKPFARDWLLAVISRLLERRRRR